jgi:acyl dehydratase
VPRILDWEALDVGMEVKIPFTVSAEDMETFARLSGDRSRIHMDGGFARSRGFREPVVYGALTVAKLSYVVGMRLPGDLGLATNWKIDFNRPLYVGDEATLSATLTHKSESTHTVKIKFNVIVEGQVIASGVAGSKILDQPA